MNQNQILRTSFKRVDPEDVKQQIEKDSQQWKVFCKEYNVESNYDGRRPFVDPNGICPYCKNQDTTTQVRDSHRLQEFKAFYDNKTCHGHIITYFEVYDCPYCSAVWSVFDIPKKLKRDQHEVQHRFL